ncbi:hypothetical protein B0H12DRAFT_219673 [Mycena haematopus]|nr:hypothetical protein B0H12DRAFT_219673 [Mycena haematopus]
MLQHRVEGREVARRSGLPRRIQALGGLDGLRVKAPAHLSSQPVAGEFSATNVEPNRVLQLNHGEHLHERSRGRPIDRYPASSYPLGAPPAGQGLRGVSPRPYAIRIRICIRIPIVRIPDVAVALHRWRRRHTPVKPPRRRLYKHTLQRPPLATRGGKLRKDIRFRFRLRLPTTITVLWTRTSSMRMGMRRRRRRSGRRKLPTAVARGPDADYVRSESSTSPLSLSYRAPPDTRGIHRPPANPSAGSDSYLDLCCGAEDETASLHFRIRALLPPSSRCPAAHHMPGARTESRILAALPFIWFRLALERRPRMGELRIRGEGGGEEWDDSIHI